MQRTIFITDDNETNLIAARSALASHYRVMTLTSASRMFDLLEKVIPDLILLDIRMPEMDGFEALERLKSNPRYVNIPVIFLTSVVDTSMEARGFERGAIDFITKPFSPAVLLNRIKTHLDIDLIIRERTAEIEDQKERIRHLKNSVVHVVADMVEKRDLTTGGHNDRIAEFVRILLTAMLEQGVYPDETEGLDFELFVSSARLHDVGKIAIPDNILNKPGKLTDVEFVIMKTHADEGRSIIEQITDRTRFRNPPMATESSSNENDSPRAVAIDDTFLSYARLFAGYHHERWDGKGYPYGLSGRTIPIHGRVMAFADVYDALVSERPYKRPFTHDESVSIIMENAGTQFDPVIALVFYSVRDQFHAMQEAMKDQSAHHP